MPSCAQCGANYDAPVYRTILCPSCGKEPETWFDCRHYSPGAAHDCREPVSEPVLEKNRANFCGWFVPESDAGGQNGPDRKHDDARRAFADLFGDD